jgi:hypothetical protein
LAVTHKTARLVVLAVVLPELIQAVTVRMALVVVVVLKITPHPARPELAETASNGMLVMVLAAAAVAVAHLA